MKPRRSSSGSTSAQLPTSPTESALPGDLRLAQNAQRVVQIARQAVAVARFEAPLDAVRVHVDAQEAGAVHGGGQRLRAAHAAHPARHHHLARERPAEVFPRQRGESFVGALHDSLAADVDPRARGHLPVHGEAEAFQARELVEVRPVSHQVGIGDEHARRFRMGAEDPCGRPDWTIRVSSFSSDWSARTMAWKDGQSRAARPRPP